jgi:hypothetical protein
VNVRPDDLANLCALFSALRMRRFNSAELEKYVQKSMLIDSNASAFQIIAEAKKCGLLNLKQGGYFLTNYGRQLGKLHKEVSCQISEKAKDFLIKKVYLYPGAGQACCFDFLNSFHVDTVLSTFVFDRQENESPDEVRWLRTLSRVGLLEVDTEYAKVNRRYLDVVNDCLRKTRNGLASEEPDVGNDRDKIGDVAEICALGYEKQRLKRRGHHDLAMLVQRISLVDKSAGYDILSYRGTGKNPESLIFIEVKGTRNDKVNFIWSRNERSVAIKWRRSYWI